MPQIGAVVVVAAGVGGFCFIFFSPPRGAVSKDGHKNKQDKEKSESWIKGSGSSVFWLQAALINRSLLWKKKKSTCTVLIQLLTVELGDFFIFVHISLLD